MGESPSKSWRILAALLLPVSVLVVFWPVLHYGFINYDDPTYVSQNPIVQGGLTWSGMQWAFSSIYGGNWHPLTWISHMLDCQLFGLRAEWHHLTSLLIHTVNSLLLLLLLQRMTGAFWRSLLVAALFALHPLHVESVVWISERKDVLSTFFFLLTLLAYVRYVKGGKVFYILALVSFAFGLMAKPMLVTLPFVLLLLDYWPLGRLKLSAVREKIPFFVLTLIACLVTIHAQSSGHAIISMKQSGVASRLANSVVAYSDYLGKTIWPGGLAVYYPHVEFPPASKFAIAVLVLIIGSVLAWRSARNRPCFLVGWLWFLGTLFPVIGIVQIGQAAMADRYSYIPLIGLFVAAAWSLSNLPILRIAAIVAVFACAVIARQQVNYWQSTDIIFRHADEVTVKNHLAKTEIGLALVAQGKTEAAKKYYLAAIEAKPDFPEAYFCLANVLLGNGKTDEAIANYRRAIILDPFYFEPRKSLGVILTLQGKWVEAVEHLRAAQKLSLGDYDVSLNLGNCLLMTGTSVEAIAEFRQALRLKPDSVEALNRLAWLFATSADAKSRDGAEAVRLARRACELTDNKDPRSLVSLAAGLAEAGQFAEAVTTVEKAQSYGQTGLSGILNHLLELFRAGKPFRENVK